MNTQQEIEQHETELKSLLSRVLKEPVSDRLNAFGLKLDGLAGDFDGLNEAWLAASANIDDYNKKLGSVAGKVNNLNAICTPLAENVGDVLAEKVEKLHEIHLNLSRTFVDEKIVGLSRNFSNQTSERLNEIVTVLGSRLTALEDRLRQELDVWKSDQATRHRELQEHVSAQLTDVERSVRAVQLMTLGFAVIGAVGVVVMLVRSAF